jgi:2-polyprenyl-6-hydroxyphenyl methylase / 3-demethylubiquinone-9 3-methyltransferase
LYGTNSTTINEEEIERFNKLSSQWWKPDGPMRLLHLMNPIRLEYIQRQVKKHGQGSNISTCSTSPLYGLNVLDVGCGAGILSEVM